MSVLTHFPKSRLSELFGRFGGLSREDAVAAASKELSVMRPEADTVILAAITQMETLVAGATRGNALMKELLPACDQLVTLAGSFGYGPLDKASRSLCDLLDGLLSQGKDDLASIRVHVRTLRIFAPGNKPLSDEHTGLMLQELQRLLDFHKIASPNNERSEDAILAAR